MHPLLPGVPGSPHRASLCIHLFCVSMRGRRRPAPTIREPGTAGADPCALLLVSPLIRAGSNTASQWEDGGEGGAREEPMVSLNAWEPVTLCQC